jgi:hypothetical protein
MKFSGVLQNANLYKKYKNNQGIFKGCIKLKGYFRGACRNYKKQDKGANYKAKDINKYKFREGAKVEIREYTTRSRRVTLALAKYKDTNRRKTK